MSDSEKKVLARGQGASPGIATGRIAFTSEEVVRLAGEGQDVIFVRVETEAEDTPGIRAAKGIVTTRGGLTSDAAIIARSLGKPCIAGCGSLVVSYVAQNVKVTGPEPRTLEKGEIITIDGAKGLVYEG